MRYVRNFVGALAIVALIEPLAGQSTSSQGADTKRLIGTWRVVSVTRPDGQAARGARPAGLIYYDASGHMAAQLMTDSSLRRPFAAEQPSPEEAQTALRDYIAYFGTYSVDEGAKRITHHPQGGITPALTLVGGNGSRVVIERMK